MAWTLVALAVVAAANEPVEADLHIRNAMIYDGSGQPPVRGGVAIQGQRIVGVGQFEVRGQPRVIDADGAWVAPGFIDLHNHSDAPITRPATRLNKNYLTQGVTTIVTGNCGGGRSDVERYLRQIDHDGAGTNVAHLIPHGALRRKVVGSQKRLARPQQLERMKKLVARGMAAGAFGMSTGLIYVPSKYADTRELIELTKVVGERGGIYVSHMRDENSRLLESVEETLDIGRQANTPVHISHFKASGHAAWGLAAEAVRMVQAVRDQGQRVTADQYPYIASSTSLAAMVVPDEFRATSRFKRAMSDAKQAKALRAALQEKIQERRGGKTLFVASYAMKRQWQGLDLESIANREKKSVEDIVVEIQMNGGAQMVNFGMQEEEVRLIMRQSFVATASDGGSKVPNSTVPHPRNYGAFPRKIGRYAIAGKTLPIAQAIYSCTGLPAKILGMSDRGLLKPGYAADIVVFDPNTFRDTATFQQPHQYATGVRCLIVNGQLAINDGKVTGVLAGKALRHQAPREEND